MAILTVKPPCTLNIIARGAPLVLLVVAVRGGCCKIIDIWDNSFLSYPFWKFICGLLWWVPTRAIYLWHAVFLDMALLTTLVTSYIWPGIWPFSRATTISTAAALEINLLQRHGAWLFNCPSILLWKLRLVLRLLFDCSWSPPLWIHNIAVFSRSLLYKGLIGYLYTSEIGRASCIGT